jgi:maleylacetoacetate isomerase
MKLYSYFRSSAAYRVRIVLNLKKIDYEIESVNLVKDEQKSKSYVGINSQGLVPSLELNDGRIITQSLAICEWIEANYDTPKLIPDDSFEAARVRACALVVASDIHPVNNLRILKYLENELGADEPGKNEWYQHWVEQGFQAIEKSLEGTTFCFGNEPSLADAFLVPQVFNALRFDVELKQYPKISAVSEACSDLAAFVNAHPDNQADNPTVVS